ncbi:pentatricopeptide repeat-containing protein At5g09450, mitochondrial isoform X2 [Gastrolobium bilobum]|uniref:pentatricopeptide repeat-containing protein At5g09450, mitochondrial isoform X2 n=1 Tax=Gastrolobium bilobum TaxID=150636 RepID=UPI002AAF4BA1|nr:pentatricopeptide repeat-containing protein At5g09450, mitochondrial isoform X2 [Gastrolobium bilobum]
MAYRSLFLSLRRNNCRYQSPCLLNRARFVSSGAVSSDFVEETPSSVESDDLRSRILRLRLPKRSATNILQKWALEGNPITVSELRDISKELRRSQRYKHALEISEWMVTHEGYELSESDYAVRIDLMTKVFGIDAAERYFEGLPLAAKTSETYTALLHSFAGEKLTEKAEELYQRIKDSNLSFDALTYNEMMTLYMSIGQVEKVPSVVEELKQQKVAPDIFTYNLWISSCAATLDIDEVRRILDEMSHGAGSNESWIRYLNLANIYITVGHLDNASSNSLVEAEKRITQRQWITYDFLIILYAGLGSKDKLDQIWNSLRMTKQKMISRNYICIISSYLMLGHTKEVGEVIDQWKQSTTTDFDMLVCKKIMVAFTDIGLAEIASNLNTILIAKNLNPGHD